MDRKKRLAKGKGFTLMEMVVVIAIIAILAMIAAPQAFRAINRSRASADIASAKNVATAIMQAMAEGYGPGSDWEKVEDSLFTGTGVDPILKKYKITPIPKVKANNNYRYYFKVTNQELVVGVGKKDGDKPSTILYPEIKEAESSTIDDIYEDFKTE